MKTLFSIGLFFLAFGLLAQSKGIIPSSPANQATSGKIHAVIVGVSEYTDSLIPDLKYAHKDATVFANWLLTQKADSSLFDRVQVFLNERATRAAVVSALGNLLDICKKGDRVYLFFSGHSDIERTIETEPGYFLCHDSPSRLYEMNALNLAYLKEITYTLTSKMECQVILVMDACHSGKLAGDLVSGTQHVAKSMAKPEPNETKFLSCKYREHSLEGTQWGGGRGVFSYYLIKGLKGEADTDRDNKVTYLEIERYVFDHVVKDVAPEQQSPELYTPNRLDVFSTFIPTQGTPTATASIDYPAQFNFAANKIVNNDLVFAGDTSVKRVYEAFYESLAAKRLMSPKADCANYYYGILKQNIRVAELHPEVTRNYAVALQDDAQVIINEFLNSNVSRIAKAGKDAIAEYTKLPGYLARAAELLGPTQYNYNNLKSNQYLFEGYLIQLTKRSMESKTEKEQKLNFYRSSLQYQPKNALASLFLSNLFASDYRNLDSCTYYYNYTKALTPTWVVPRAYYAYMLNRYLDAVELAKTTIDEGLFLDSTNTTLIKSLGAYYFYKEDYANARLIYLKAIALDSTDFLTISALAATYQQSNDIENAKYFYQKSIQLNPNQYSAYNSLGWLHYEKGEMAQAVNNYKRGLQNNDQLIILQYRLALCYLETKDFLMVKALIDKIIKINPEDWRAPFLKACIAAIKGNDQAALKFLEEAVTKEKVDSDVLENKDYFRRLKTNKKYIELIEE